MESVEAEAGRLEDELEVKLPKLHECDQNLQIRLRFISNTPKGQYVRQCLVCGRQKRGPLSEKSALKELNGLSPEVFDNTIEELINKRRRVILTRLKEIRQENLAQMDPTDLTELQIYLQQRDDSIAQSKSIIDAAIEAVGAINGKEQVPDLFLRQLMPLRKEIRTLHAAKVNRFSSEEELKSWIVTRLDTDFLIYREVAGRHVSSGITVVIDYVLYPKEHLIVGGFVASYFGLEVKYINQDNGFTRKASRGIWQTISYTDSVFTLNGRETPLAFALLFSNLSFESEQKLLETFRGHHYTENDQAEWIAMLQLANHANVGTFRIQGERDSWRGWCH